MIREGRREDSLILANMAKNIWNNENINELEEEFIEMANNKDESTFIKFIDNEPVGFANVGLRYDYVEGTETSPVGYLEGIYVEEEFRRRGFAGDLVKFCEKWSKEKGCQEFASDCLLENEESYKFHLAIGFMEANRIICFKKSL